MKPARALWIEGLLWGLVGVGLIEFIKLAAEWGPIVVLIVGGSR